MGVTILTFMSTHYKQFAIGVSNKEVIYLCLYIVLCLIIVLDISNKEIISFFFVNWCIVRNQNRFCFVKAALNIS